MTDLQAEAREFLAREYDGDDEFFASHVRKGLVEFPRVFDAMLAFRAAGEAKARREALETNGLSIHVGPDGTWLRFITSDGKSAAFRIESMSEARLHDGRAGIRAQVLDQWCQDRRALIDAPAQTEKVIT